MIQKNGLKYCSHCKKQYPISFFHKCKYQPDGFKNQCKECSSKYQKIHRKKNIEKIRKRNTKNLPKRRERERKRKQKDQEYYQNYIQYQREYRKKNKKELNKKQKKKWKRNKTKYRKQKREHYKENTEKILKRNSEYRQTDAGRNASARHHNKRRKLGNKELLQNVLDKSEKPVQHHINNKEYVWIPLDLHLSFLFGKNTKKHRDYLKSIVEQIYKIKI